MIKLCVNEDAQSIRRGQNDLDGIELQIEAVLSLYGPSLVVSSRCTICFDIRCQRSGRYRAGLGYLVEI
ncbi:hypothetical protein ES702_01833 [subsurface metagenome]